MDMLTLVSADGSVVFRAHNPDASGDDVSAIPVIMKALEEKRVVSGTCIVGEDFLQRVAKIVLSKVVIVHAIRIKIT